MTDTPFGLRKADPVPARRRRCFVAAGEIDPNPHDLMWIDESGDARQISSDVIRTVDLAGRECLLFEKWADEKTREGWFLEPQNGTMNSAAQPS